MTRRMDGRIAVLALALLPVACQISESGREVRPTPVARVSSPEQGWRVVAGAKTLGFVVRFREPDGRIFFSVRNAWHQDLGMIDGLGRAWAYRLHVDEPVWVSTGTVAEGAAEILGAEEPCVLVEVPEVELDGPSR